MLRRPGELNSLERAGYVVTNLAKNSLAPVFIRVLPSRGRLGMDGNLDAVVQALNALARGLGFVNIQGARVLELGPGRTPDICAALALCGAAETIGVDSAAAVPANWKAPGRFAALASQLAGSKTDHVRDALNVDAARILRRYRMFERGGWPMTFTTTDSRGQFPLSSESLDLVISKSVLEHVRMEELGTFLSEMGRVLRDGGIAVHLVDLRDHMHISGDEAVHGDWLDALRYPSWLFQAMFSHRSTRINRLRLPEWLVLFEDAKFEVVDREEVRLPLPSGFSRSSLQPPWRFMDEKVLSVAMFAVVLQRRPRTRAADPAKNANGGSRI